MCSAGYTGDAGACGSTSLIFIISGHAAATASRRLLLYLRMLTLYAVADYAATIAISFGEPRHTLKSYVSFWPLDIIIDLLLYGYL